MTIYFIDTLRKETQGVLNRFKAGIEHRTGGVCPRILPGEVIELGLPTDATAVVCMGILRGSGHIIRDAQSHGVDYYHVDHAYFNPNPKYDDPNGWFRITKNALVANSMWYRNPGRYLKHFADRYPIEPWRDITNRGDNILILPPSDAVSWFHGFEQNDWEDRAIDIMREAIPKERTDRIVVRRKGESPTVNANGDFVGFKYESYDRSLEQDINDAAWVVAYNSTVALKATLMGIPVMTSRNNCCWPISHGGSRFRWDEPKSGAFVHRNLLVNWLAHQQFTLEEMENGVAWAEVSSGPWHDALSEDT